MPGRHATIKDYREALEGLTLPAARDVIRNRVGDRGGHDREVDFILAMVEDRRYETMEELEAEIERVYAASGGLPVGRPAAKPGAAKAEA